MTRIGKSPKSSSRSNRVTRTAKRFERRGLVDDPRAVDSPEDTLSSVNKVVRELKARGIEGTSHLEVLENYERYLLAMVNDKVSQTIGTMRADFAAYKRDEPKRFEVYLARYHHDTNKLPPLSPDEMTPEVFAEVKACKAHSYDVEVLKTVAGKQVVWHKQNGVG